MRNWFELCDIFREMEERDITSSKVTFTIPIDSFVPSGDMENGRLVPES